MFEDLYSLVSGFILELRVFFRIEAVLPFDVPVLFVTASLTFFVLIFEVLLDLLSHSDLLLMPLYDLFEDILERPRDWTGDLLEWMLF